MSTQTEALRKLAAFIDQNGEELGTTEPKWYGASVSMYDTALTFDVGFLLDADAQKDRARRIMRVIGGTWDKDPGGVTMEFRQDGFLGFFKVAVSVKRDSVCERVLIREDVEELPAREAMTLRTPVYEWQCGSLLAPVEKEAVLV